VLGVGGRRASGLTFCRLDVYRGAMTSKKLTHPLLAVLSVVFMVAGIAMPSEEVSAQNKKPPKVEEKKEPKPPKLPRPKTKDWVCPDERYTILRDAKKAVCEPDEKNLTKCREEWTIKELYDRERAFTACANARETFDKECWNGGNPGHKQAQVDARKGAENCRAERVKKETREEQEKQKEKAKREEEEKRKREEEEKRKREEEKPFEWKDLLKIPRIIS
jgi:putative RNase toxin 16 of polymorphic toxin system